MKEIITKKSFFSTFLATIIFFIICNAADSGLRENIKIDNLCKKINNSYECAQTIERYQIKKYSKYITRSETNEGKFLKIKLKNSAVKTYKDINLESEEDVLFSFRDYLQDIGYFIVHYQLWEGDGYIMINDKTGFETPLSELPVISPDRKRIISVSASIAYNWNGIVIYKFTPKDMVLEFNYDTEKVGLFYFEKWINNKAVKLKKCIGIEEAKCCTQILKFESGKWKLIEKSNEK